MKVFLSFENHGPSRWIGLHGRIPLLFAALKAGGAEVVMSPVATGDLRDPRWDGWYDRGLAEELKRVDAFVGADGGNSGSTWMANEYGTALQLQAAGELPKVYYWEHPDSPVNLRSCWGSYAERSLLLPGDPEAAAAELLSTR